MKKLLLLITALFLLVSVEGQILRYSNYVAPTPPSGDYCAEYNTVLAAFGTAPSLEIQTAQNAMVKALVDAGLWSRMDGFYVLANNTNANANVNWVNPGTYNAVNSYGDCTWSAYVGYTGNPGSWGNIETGITPASGGYHYTLNSATVGVVTTTGGENLVGMADNADPQNVICIDAPSRYTTYRVCINNTYSNGIVVTGQTTGVGHWTASRTGSTAGGVYRNGVQVATSLNASDAIPSADGEMIRFLYAYNPSAATIQLGYIMDGVTSEEAAILNSAIQDYLDAININVSGS